jgi:hypothetical protein
MSRAIFEYAVIPSEPDVSVTVVPNYPEAGFSLGITSALRVIQEQTVS